MGALAVPSTDNDSRASRFLLVRGYQRNDATGDFGATDGGWLDRICVVFRGRANEPQINHCQPEFDSHSQDDVIEYHQSRGSEALEFGVWEVAVVDGAKDKRQFRLKASSHGMAILFLEFLRKIGQRAYGLGYVINGAIQ